MCVIDDKDRVLQPGRLYADSAHMNTLNGYVLNVLGDFILSNYFIHCLSHFEAKHRYLRALSHMYFSLRSEFFSLTRDFQAPPAARSGSEGTS